MMLRALSPMNIALPIVLLAGIAAICLLFSAAPRQYFATPDRLRFPGKAIDAGLHNVEHSTDPGAPISYRWTNGAARVVLPNPGGPLNLRLMLAAGNGRRTDVTISTAHDRLEFVVGAAPRVYHLLLPPQPAELFALRITSPTFIEPGGSRQLGVILADVDVFGGGRPVRTVMLSGLLSGLLIYLIAQRWFRPLLAAGLSLAAQTIILAWQSGSGWPQGIFFALQSVGVAGVALLGLLSALASPGGIEPRGAARPSDAVLVARGAMVALFLSAAVWTQIVLVPRLASDLVIYLRAASRAFAGSDPYQPFLIGVSYVYPPPALALFGPLTALSQPDAQSFWRVLSALSVLASLLALRRAFAMAVPVPLGTTWLLALAFCFAPLWESLSIGQVNAVVLLGISMFILGYRDRRWAWAGDLGLAGAIMLKISPLLLLALPIMRADWRRCARVGLGLLGLILLALPWFGPQIWADFLAILPLLLQGSDANPFNLSLAALGFRIAGPVALLGRLIAAALPALWLLHCLRERRSDPRPLLVLGVLAMTLGSNLVWYHHLVFLAVPAAWLLIGTTGGGPALAGLLGLALVQVARPAEFGLGLGLGPWLAGIGYLVVLGATLAGMRRAAMPDPL